MKLVVKSYDLENFCKEKLLKYHKILLEEEVSFCYKEPVD